jgi:CelD/BcsL family acetyltransferase involved in cellulose biosynthesis
VPARWSTSSIGPAAALCSHPRFSRAGWRCSLSTKPNEHRYEVLIEQHTAGLARRWNSDASQAAATPFQSGLWLETWYATIGSAIGEPILLTAIDRASGKIAARLPLIQRDSGGLRVIEFADHGVSDNNALILGSAAPRDAPGARMLWTALRGALPKADLVRFTKMPFEIDGQINPLVLLRSARRSRLSRNVITIESWNDYLSGLQRTFRKQIDRSWRAFASHDGGTFRQIQNCEEASRVFGELERQQSVRMRSRGSPYHLDKEEFAAFYRRLASEGVADGTVVLTALMQHDEVVAALLGMVRGTTYVMVRVSIGSNRWAHYSPGRLVIMQTMQMLHARGYRHFDLSIGDQDYKRRLGGRPHRLFDLTQALTVRGMPMLVLDRTKHFVRQHPGLLAVARGMARLSPGFGPATRP